MASLKFTACKYLDFSDNYTAEKNLIQVEGEMKVCWNRPVIDDSFPQLVQFCKKRGRMNNPEMCVCVENQQCQDYEDVIHEVDLSTVNCL